MPTMPLVDAYAAASSLNVKPANIRLRAHRGYLKKLGRDPQGRILYDY